MNMLHDKLDRKRTVEETNEKVCESFQENFEANADSILSVIQQYREQQQMPLVPLSRDLPDIDGAIFEQPVQAMPSDVFGKSVEREAMAEGGDDKKDEEKPRDRDRDRDRTNTIIFYRINHLYKA